MKVRLNDMAFRRAILKAYNEKCVYSGQPLDFENLTVDHIIPQSLMKNKNKFRSYLDVLGIDATNFEIDSIYNLVPAKFRLNRQKGNDLLDRTFALTLLELAKKKAPKIISEVNNFKQRKNISKSIEEVRSYVLLSDDFKKEQVFDFVTEDKNVFKNEKVIDGRSYKQSTERIKLEAFLPSYPEREGSCLITFRSLKIRECMITMNHKQIMKELFQGLYTEPEHKLRYFIVGNDISNKDVYFIQLGNNRFPVTISELKQLCNLVDSFSEYYLNAHQVIEQKIGTFYFNKSPYSSKYRLMKISRKLWNLMIEFINKHDYENGDTNWHIFDKNKFFIKIYSKKETNRFDEGYHAFLEPEQDENFMMQLTEPDNYLWIVWEPHMSIDYNNSLDNINERKMWDALTVYDWLSTEFIPWVVYTNYSKTNKIFLNKKTTENQYENFIKNFNIEDFISSGKIETTIDIESTQNQQQLLQVVDNLQMFFNSYSESIVFKKDHFKNLFEALALIIKRSDEIDYKYINSKIGFTNGETKDQIYFEIMSYVPKIEYSIKSGFFIDNILRCLVIILRDYTSYLNKSEIKIIVNYLKPFFYRKSLIETIQKI
ncbi:HNH endonuclease domain-containing protein [Pseudogracilibacillus sp. SE30717A]|uniref:HNH endonuclease n=1 Tax=Pseudogracilibacillus sp. SE30717A TaxID=3098293 RepID=UPI00300E37D3